MCSFLLKFKHIFWFILFYLFLLILSNWPQWKGEGEIQTNKLRFMRRGPQSIKLPLRVSWWLGIYKNFIIYFCLMCLWNLRMKYLQLGLYLLSGRSNWKFVFVFLLQQVLGTDELNTYLNKYRIELDPHLAALVGRLGSISWFYPFLVYFSLCCFTRHH